MKWLSLAALTLTYLMALGSFTWPDAVVGAVLSLALLRVFGEHLFRGEVGAQHLQGAVAAFPAFLFQVLYRFMTASFSTGWLVLKGAGEGRRVRVPLGERTPLGVAVTAWWATLSPGTILVEVNSEAREMVFHTLGVEESALQQELDNFYRDYQSRVFP